MPEQSTWSEATIQHLLRLSQICYESKLYTPDHIPLHLQMVISGAVGFGDRKRARLLLPQHRKHSVIPKQECVSASEMNWGGNMLGVCHGRHNHHQQTQMYKRPIPAEYDQNAKSSLPEGTHNLVPPVVAWVCAHVCGALSAKYDGQTSSRGR